MPDGNPTSLKIIDKMNWTGIGVNFSRDSWPLHRGRSEFEQSGIYILLGYQESEDIPTLYIGQGDALRNRIDAHYKNKPFWDRGVAFVSSNSGLNRAHITWLEWALIQKAKRAGRANLDNTVTPNEPGLTEAEKSDTQAFLSEILSILPLIEIRVFEKAELIEAKVQSDNPKTAMLDTLVVPAQVEGFNRVFLGEQCWYAVRIAGGKLKDIKYIAAYQTAPISQITHVATVASIEPYGDGGKYKVNFDGAAREIAPIEFGNAKPGAMQSSRYTSYEKLLSAKSIVDLFDTP